MNDGFVIDKSLRESAEGIWLPNIISDNMLLQRGKPITLWGRVKDDCLVAVEIKGKIYRSCAKKGTFEIILPPMRAENEAFDITFYTPKEKRTVKNVLVGDVFLMSGQSNMQYYVFMALEGDQGLHALESTKYIPTIENDPLTYASYERDSEERNKGIIDFVRSQIKPNDKIRLGGIELTPPDDRSYEGLTSPAEDVKLSWAEADERSITNFSVFAYYFAVRMNSVLSVPIGVVCNAVGGTFVATWMPNEAFIAHKTDFKYGNTSDETNYLNLHSRCFNAYTAPLSRFTFNGVVWYQGEGQHDNYQPTLELLVSEWRRTFKDDKLPFLIVELPRYGGGDVLPEGYGKMPIDSGCEDHSYYRVRQAQRAVAEKTDNVALSVNVDLGDYDEIHPSDKFPIANRAADKYLEAFYGLTEYKRTPELICAAKADDLTAELTFDKTGGGVKVVNGGRNVLVSSGGASYEPASEVFKRGDKIIIKSKNPLKRIKYGYFNYPRIDRNDVKKYLSLFSVDGYPVDQFEIELND